MAEETKYGVIHELGDYSAFKPVSDEDNKILNEQFKEEKEKNK